MAIGGWTNGWSWQELFPYGLGLASDLYLCFFYWANSTAGGWFHSVDKWCEMPKSLKKIKLEKTLSLINSGVHFRVIMGWILNQTNGENRESTTGAPIPSSTLEVALQTQQLFCAFESRDQRRRWSSIFFSQPILFLRPLLLQNNLPRDNIIS